MTQSENRESIYGAKNSGERARTERSAGGRASYGWTSIGVRPFRRAAERGPDHPLVRAFRQAGMDLLDASLPERIDHASVAKLLARAPETAGKEFLGLSLAEQLEPSDIGILHYIARSSPTLRVAVEKCAPYITMLHDGLKVELRPCGRSLTWVCFVLPAELLVPPAMVEVVLAFTLKLFRGLSGVQLSPVAVRFRNPPPGDTDYYRRFFQAPCQFDSDFFGLLMHDQSLRLPIPSADPQLCQLLEERARQMTVLSPTGTGTGTANRVRRIVVGLLAEGCPDIDHVASRLHMSPRTLRRRLEQEGVKYQEVVNQLRVNLAKRYLDDRRGVEEVASLLGYSSSHAFRRAFKRQTGLLPAAYRGQARRPHG